MKTRGRRVVALSCVGALGIGALLATLRRGEIAAWFYPPPDARRSLVALELRWDEKEGVRCWATPYLRPDGTWLDVHELSTDPGPGAAEGRPALGEIETYLEFRRRDRTPWFGEPGRLTVLVHHDREVPWRLVRDIIELCRKLGIVDVDIDSED